MALNLLALKYVVLILLAIPITTPVNSKNMDIKMEIIIQKQVKTVFEFLSNFENMPKWNYYVMKVSKTTEGPVRYGTVFHQLRKSDKQDYEIIEFEYPNQITIETLPPKRHLTMRFKLLETGNGTLVEDEWQLEVPWFIGLFARNRIRSAVSENLGKLKTLLETGQAVLQDGRTKRLQ